VILSSDCVLVYVLRHSGVAGRLTSGKIELEEGKGLMVYDSFGVLNEYVSGDRLRSWSVFDRGIPIPEWSQVAPEDARLVGEKAETIRNLGDSNP
jgi:hypothetical protein